MKAGFFGRCFIFFLMIIPAVIASENSRETFITLATTTSTENSGLLAYLNPEFTRETGIAVHVIAKGTGAALKIASNGDADVVMVHSPSRETAFVEAGHGTKRYPLMHNDFILVGPPSDPAEAKELDILDALDRIAASGNLFISRGDHSGTHDKELFLWKETKSKPDCRQILSIGQGMGKTLMMANEKQAYTLTDRGTYLFMKDQLNLIVISQGSPLLFNPYHVIPVNPEKHPHAKYDLAMRYIRWLTSEEGRKRIAGYRVAGEALFFPDPPVSESHE